MPALLPHLTAQLAQLQPPKLTIALSGGLDSVVLLHLLCRAREHRDLALNAIHVHHGLSPNADSWQHFCAELCQEWNVPFQAQKVQLNLQGRGIEAAARQARYQAFAQLGAQTVALAHHSDDQAETLLLAIMRGGGVRALSAMGETQTLHTLSGSLKLWRPLLSFSRQDLADYAAKHELNWIEDESNQDTRYLRNFVRQQWLPELQNRLPNARAQLLSSVAALQDDLALLNEYSEMDVAQVCASGKFHVPTWLTLSDIRARNVLKSWLNAQNLGTPTRESIYEFARVLRNAETGEWRLPRGKVFFYRQSLTLLHDDDLARCFWLSHPISGCLKDFAVKYKLTFSHDFNGLSEHSNTIYHIRAAQKNDRLLMSNGHHQAVFKILAQHGTPAPLRGLFPVLTNENNEILTIFNIRSSTLWTENTLPQLDFLQRWLA
ncbi:tRNA lysidine(34) synthetase TilS [Neisseriaceae bacterium B1]